MLPPRRRLPAALLCWLSGFSLASTLEGQEIKAESGEDVVLPCQVPRGSTITLLEWIRRDLESDGYMFFYRNSRSYENYQHPSFRGRVELRNRSSVKDGDVSVILKRASVNDTGTYECQTIVNTGSSEKTNAEFRDLVRLNVADPGGDTEDGANEDGRNKDTELEDGRNKDRYFPIVISVSVIAVVLLVVVGFAGALIFRKHKRPIESPDLSAKKAGNRLTI